MPPKHPLYVEQDVLNLLKDGHSKSSAARKMDVSSHYASSVYQKYIDEMPSTDKVFYFKNKLEEMAQRKGFDLEALPAKHDIPLRDFNMTIKQSAYPAYCMRALMEDMQLTQSERFELLEAAWRQIQRNVKSTRDKLFVGFSDHYAEEITKNAITSKSHKACRKRT